MVCPYRVAIVACSALAALVAMWFYNRCDDDEEESEQPEVLPQTPYA